MPFEQVEAHDDLLTTNGFVFEIDGQPIVAVTKVGGFSREVGAIEWTDGATGITENFSDQRKIYGPCTISYYVDPTTSDFDKLRAYVNATHKFGTRFDFSVVKYNHALEVFRIAVYKGLFRKEDLPELDKNASGPYEVTLEIPCSYIEVRQ